MIFASSLINKHNISFSQSKNAQTNPIAIAASPVEKEARGMAQEGDELLKTNNFDAAISKYNKSIEINPEAKETYLSLGKAYKGKEDYPNAASNIEIYLKENPQDTGAIVLLGDCYRKQGHYGKAIEQFSNASSIDSSDDEAKRNYLETKNQIQACYDPIGAAQAKRKQALSNLSTALGMAKKYLSPDFMKDMGNLTIVFDKTASLGGTPNIAQYEHSKRKMTVTDSYVYAAPQLVAAYMVHEFVHAKDKDSYTSINEEQDAYKKETEFWIQNSNGVKDPEMDYAAELYKQSPSTLDSRVAEIYKLRDPSIAKISPNHPPGNTKLASTSLNQTNSGQPLQNYEIIS